jgi:hypothetical protein
VAVGDVLRRGVEQEWQNMAFTFDPMAATLKKMTADAKEAGLLDSSVSD